MPESDKARADQSQCQVCWDEGWIEKDQQVQEVGKVAQPVPCPACSGRRCESCRTRKHYLCNGIALNEQLGIAVDCECDSKVHIGLDHSGIRIVLPPWSSV